MSHRPADQQTFQFKGYNAPSAVGEVRVGSEDVLGARVDGLDAPAAMAQAIADQINAHTSDPNYEARAVGKRVIIIAPDFGEDPNGLPVEVVAYGDVEISNVLNMSGGVAPQFLKDATSEPGKFVKTVGSKMYSLSRSVKHFSGIGEPTIFTPEATGAGFVDLATYAAGAEDLVVLEDYFDGIAVFARNSVQIWSIDPDPAAIRQEQVLHNVGTLAPQSIEAVGDVDLFYLDGPGIRSLRPRGEVTFASVADVGLPIDQVVRDHIATVSADTLQRARATIEPNEGRYWLAIGSKVFVLSRYVSSKISAWCVYELPFNVDEIVNIGERIYVRAGNTIYLYGGSSGNTFDASEVRVRIPYLDGQKPADTKLWREVSVAAEGNWTVTVYSDPDAPDEADDTTVLQGVTYGKLRHPIQAHSSHLSLLFVNEESGPAKISNMAVHFDAAESG